MKGFCFCLIFSPKRGKVSTLLHKVSTLFIILGGMSTNPAQITPTLVRFWHFWASGVLIPPRLLLLLSGFGISGRAEYSSRPDYYYSCQVLAFLGERSTHPAQTTTTLVGFWHFWASGVVIPPRLPLLLSGFGNSGRAEWLSRPDYYYSCQVLAFLGERSGYPAQITTTLVGCLIPHVCWIIL